MFIKAVELDRLKRKLAFEMELTRTYGNYMTSLAQENGKLQGELLLLKAENARLRSKKAIEEAGQ